MSESIAVVGPTATGKSQLALSIAQHLGAADAAEIINADAYQLYKGMDIGTAKLTPAERGGIRHHQFDVVEVDQEASVAAYQRHALADAADITKRGKKVIWVGGSGLYLRAVTDDFAFPATDASVREHFEARWQSEGGQVLYSELEHLDPLAATRIQATDRRRVVRALEVIELTGKPYSASLPTYRDRVPTVHLALRVEREALRQAIARRTRKMFDAGLIEETRALLDKGLRNSPTASRAIGYTQAIAVIDGQMSQEQACEAVTLATNQLVSRQLKWFRRDPRVNWIDVELTKQGYLEPAQARAAYAKAFALLER